MENSERLIEEIEKPESGGVLVHLRGYKYPVKGFVTKGSVWSADAAKRLLIALLRRPWFLLFHKSIVSFYVEAAVAGIRPYLLPVHEYNTFPRAVMTFTETLLIRLGHHHRIARAFALIIGHIFEQDNAYRYRLEDLMSLTSADALLKDPRKEVLRLFNIFLQRQHRPKVKASFGLVVRIALVAFRIPWFKSAFKEALLSINFKHLQLDEIDRYHILSWDGYDFLGLPAFVRAQMLKKINDTHE